MKNKIIFGTCLLCMTSLVLGQSVQDIFGAPPPQNTVDQVDEEYWDALDDFVPFEGAQNDEFDWNLLKALNKRITNDNILVSPLSIKLLLTMMSDAARADTLKELQSVLQLPGNPQATRERVKTVLDSLKVQHKDYTLEVGTRLYLSENIKPRQRFAAIIKMFYSTDLVPLDFTKKEESVQVVNNWVGNVTHGKIKDLVSADDLENAVLLMLNAIYFKGAWRQSFLLNETKPDNFYLTPNQQITVNYMSRTGQYFFLESKELDAKILRIPYRGRKFSMFFILPNSKGGLSQLVDDLTSVVLRRHLWLMDELEVKVQIPKFQFDVTSQLSDVLKEMGLTSLFSDYASLPGLARGVNTVQRLSVSNVLQKAGLEVNEQGSTLYAATEIVLTNKFGSEGNHEFIASRPFLFFVEDETTGAILFSGKVVNPLSGKSEILDSKPTIKPAGLTNRFSDIDDGAGTGDEKQKPTPTSTSTAQQTIKQPSVQDPALLATGLTSPLTLNPSTQNKPSQRFHYFDIDLLKAVTTVDNNRNVMISPASVKATLAMLLEGARGPGADEIRGALRLSSDQNLVRRQIYDFLLSLQKRSPGVTLEVANRIFMADYLSLKPEYSSIIRQNYLSDVTKVNFSKPQETANTVNTWVNQVTHGLIPSLVEAAHFDSTSMLLLANALYFKGNWENAFDAGATIVRCFHTPRQTCREVYMMEITKYFNYADVHELDAQALEIPYQDGKYSMILLLPNKETGIADLIRDIPYKSLSAIIEQMEQQEVQVTLPRFKIDYSIDLVPMLQEVGIRTIFGARANLSGIINSDNLVQVSNVFHKTHIDVNEQGSIAAAVTGAMVIPLMGSTSERFRVDHPFLFFIRDLETGQILFEGKVVEPIEAQGTPQTVNQQPEVQTYFSAPPPNNVQQSQQPAYIPSFTVPQSVQTQQPQYQQTQQPQYVQQSNTAYVQQSLQNGYIQQTQQNGYTQQTTSQGNNIEKQPIVFINSEPEQHSVPIITPVKTAVKVTPPLVRFSSASSQDNYGNVQTPSRVTITRQTESQTQYSSRQVYPGSSFLPEPQYLMSAYQQPLPNYPDGIAFERA